MYVVAAMQIHLNKVCWKMYERHDNRFSTYSQMFYIFLDDCKNKQKANKEDMELASQISFKVIELECARIKQLNDTSSYTK